MAEASQLCELQAIEVDDQGCLGALKSDISDVKIQLIICKRGIEKSIHINFVRGIVKKENAMFMLSTKEDFYLNIHTSSSLSSKSTFPNSSFPYATCHGYCECGRAIKHTTKWGTLTPRLRAMSDLSAVFDHSATVPAAVKA
jgi:hypothetical protein